MYTNGILSLFCLRAPTTLVFGRSLGNSSPWLRFVLIMDVLYEWDLPLTYLVSRGMLENNISLGSSSPWVRSVLIMDVLHDWDLPLTYHVSRGMLEKTFFLGMGFET